MPAQMLSAAEQINRLIASLETTIIIMCMYHCVCHTACGSVAYIIVI